MKKKLIFNKNLTIILIALSILMLFFPVGALMTHVEKLLNDDVEVSLSEIVTQNKNVIQSKISIEINNLKLVSSQVLSNLQNNDTSKEALVASFRQYMKDSSEDIFFADTEGKAYYADGSTITIKGRNYYKLAITGTNNISEKLISRKTGEPVYIFSIPILHQNKVIGTMQRAYTAEEINNVFSVSLYSDEGFMYVINAEGYSIFHSQHKDCKQISSNYYRDIYENGNEEASRQLERKIKNNESGFFEVSIEGSKYFAAFTPLEALHNWYLISSVSTKVISYNSSVVMKIFYAVLAIIILIFLLIAFIYWRTINRKQKQLMEVAFVDNVTKGNTLNKFIVWLQDTLAKQDNATWHIWKFDIDNFKYINKYYGFDLGDEILRYITEQIEAQLQDGEIIARISSDNFVALLQDASAQRIDILLKKVRLIHNITIFYSSGIYQIVDRSENVNLMIDKASIAASLIKDVANHKIAFYTHQFELQLKENEELKRAINQAFVEDEFIPYFQPKVNVETNEIIGCEALARWRTKDKGLISPSVFVPVCEKTGLVKELDMVIFEKVLIFIRHCLDHGITCYPISINFSRVHLEDETFLHKIVNKMKMYHIPRHLIELELTESALFDNLDIILQFTNYLHELGLKLAMDDFGSGYSSLNMLKEIPIDVLKIDKEFLKETSDNERREIIFAAVVEMAKKLHIKVVVEGVETKENIDLMMASGCCFAQGYYFAKPMNETDIISLYKEGKVK